MYNLKRYLYLRQHGYKYTIASSSHTLIIALLSGIHLEVKNWKTFCQTKKGMHPATITNTGMKKFHATQNQLFLTDKFWQYKESNFKYTLIHI